MLYIIRYFFVQCLYSVDDIRCGELVSEVVPCADFVSDVSIESGAIMFNSPGRDMLFTVVYDDGGEVFSGCVFVSEVVYVEVCECGVDVVGELHQTSTSTRLEILFCMITHWATYSRE